MANTLASNILSTLVHKGTSSADPSSFLHLTAPLANPPAPPRRDFRNPRPPILRLHRPFACDSGGIPNPRRNLRLHRLRRCLRSRQPRGTNGVALERLLWVRCNRKPDYALKAADWILHGGGFGVVILDLCDASPEMLRRIPLPWWYRFRRAVESTHLDSGHRGNPPDRGFLCVLHHSDGAPRHALVRLRAGSRSRRNRFSRRFQKTGARQRLTPLHAFLAG